MSQDALVELSTYLNLIVKYEGKVAIPYEFVEEGLDRSEFVRISRDEDNQVLVFTIEKLKEGEDAEQ